MDLTKDRWIPSLTRGDLTLAEALDAPLLDLQSGRPDFDFAILLIAIGLRQTGYAPPPLLGDGERFLQRRADKSTPKPIGQLLLDEPSENAIKHGADHFRCGNQRDSLCPRCAMLALYVDCQFGGPKGPGLYPGNLYHYALYLRRGETLRETVETNLIADEIEPDAYFGAPNAYWLADPEPDGECALCGASGPVITTVQRGKGRAVAVDNPHCARTRNGRRYAISPTGSDVDIAAGVAIDSEAAIPPPAITANTSEGDLILGFGTYYEKAKLQRTFEATFRLGPARNQRVLRQCLWSIWGVRFPGAQVDQDSALAGSVARTLADRLEAGETELDAALAVFDRHCPPPPIERGKDYAAWRIFRGRIREKAAAHSPTG